VKKKEKLIVFSYKQIKSWKPCYDPLKYVSVDWRGTVVDVLKHKDVPPRDKLWCVCREELLDAGLLRRFAVAQAKTCRKSVKDKKEFDRILKVCLRFADGRATNRELSAARSAALSTASDAAWSAASDAASDAARSASLSAALDAVWSASLSAASDAARSVDWSATRSAARSASCKMLLKMVREFYNCRRIK